MKRKAYLGIDTSNYTTSAALCDGEGELIADQRKVLSVNSGERGLRQSEALFQHTKNLPECIAGIDLSAFELAGIGVSVTPRPVADSYMPVFLAGIGTARSLAHLTDVPLVTVSHQENHIRGAIYGCGLFPEEMTFPILATHFSGGTSEIIRVERRETGFDCKIIGETLDLNAGQLIDRVGVAMGLPFPAGKALEKLAMPYADSGSALRISSRVEGTRFHFSGQENQAMRLLKAGEDPGAVAHALLMSVAKTLENALRNAAKATGIRTVVFSGGVMANQIIKQRLIRRFDGSGMRLYFSDPRYATDNAVGCALLAMDHLSGAR